MAIFQRVTFSKAHHFGYPCQFSGVYIPPYFHYVQFSILFIIWEKYDSDTCQQKHQFVTSWGKSRAGTVDVEGQLYFLFRGLSLVFRGCILFYSFSTKVMAVTKFWKITVFEHKYIFPRALFSASSFFLFEEDSAGFHLLSVFCRLIFPSNPHAHIASRHLAVC